MFTQQKSGIGNPKTTRNAIEYHACNTISEAEIGAQLRKAMQNAGIKPPHDLKLDGNIHSFSTNGRRGDDAGRYQIFTDGIPAGWFQDHRTTGVIKFRMDVGRDLTAPENHHYQQQMTVMQAEREAEATQRQTEAANKAKRLLDKASPASPDHAYLQRKQMKPVANMSMLPIEEVTKILGYPPSSRGTKLEGNILILPVTVEGELTTCELIDPTGRKSAIAGGRKKGGCWMPEPIPRDAAIIVIGEGAATVSSIHESCTLPVVAALSAGNLEEIARQFRESHTSAELIILADLTKDTREPDPHATTTANAIAGRLAVPDLQPEQGKDWNDYFVLNGPEKTRAAISAAEKYIPGWPEPQPFVVIPEPQPYPIDAWPLPLREVIEEVANHVQAPIPLIASSLLGTLSLAFQGLANVARDCNLVGPVGLFILSIAESGERKSTVDRYFTDPIRQFMETRSKELEPDMNRYRAALHAWEAEYTGTKDKIKQNAKKGIPTDRERQQLEALERNKPERPRIPELLYQDITPEALAIKLATVWPAGGIVSSEAGSVFGAHAMNSETIVRTLTLYNILWDGGSHKIDRKTSDPIEVKGARLTMCLAIQAPTLREIFNKSGTLQRGTGWLARFLLAWPKSTQGTRFYKEPPEQMPALSGFHRRIKELLELPLAFDEYGRLKPSLLNLTQEAKQEWIHYYNGIESELRPGGDACDIKDVASKSADNAARIAALFQIYEHGLTDISLAAFEGAARLAAWHLYEARRFFKELASPPELLEAARLDAWLIENKEPSVTRRVLQQYTRIRDGDRLDAALSLLSDLNRVRVHQKGTTKNVVINPRLLS